LGVSRSFGPTAGWEVDFPGFARMGHPAELQGSDKCVIQTSGEERIVEGRGARSYAAWISLYCGLAALLFIAFFFLHLQLVSPKGTGIRWIGLWFALAWLSSLLGIITGILGKDRPRALGLSLSTCIFIAFFGLAFYT
jgi:hypothetical protein